MIIIWLVSGLTRLDLTKPENVLLFVCIDSKPVKQKTSGTVILPPEVSVLCSNLPIKSRTIGKKWLRRLMQETNERRLPWYTRLTSARSFVIGSSARNLHKVDAQLQWTSSSSWPTDKTDELIKDKKCSTIFSSFPTFPIVICWQRLQCSPTYLHSYLPTDLPVVIFES